jgi:Kdo2-lipid IVA lauroyltransferase/acyltransferase
MTTSGFFTQTLLKVLEWVSKLPYGWVSRLGRGLGFLAYLIATRRRRIARKNLELCLPNLSKKAREKIVRSHFLFYGRGFLERFIFWNGSQERIQNLVTLVGLEHFESVRGKPVIVLAPHFLGLDAGGIRFQIETQFVSMYAKQSNPTLDAATIAGRSRFNSPILLSRQDGLLPAVRLLRAGTPFYFLPDMDLGPREAVFAPFFGVPAATVTSVARLAKITGATVLPLVTTMGTDGYVAQFYPAWKNFPLHDDFAAAQMMNRFIEDRVMEAPAQYLWTHKRFKTRPLGEASFYK